MTAAAVKQLPVELSSKCRTDRTRAGQRRFALPIGSNAQQKQRGQVGDSADKIDRPVTISRATDPQLSVPQISTPPPGVHLPLMLTTLPASPEKYE